MARDVSLKDLLQEFAEGRGFDFRGYKKTTLERRLRRRMFQLNIGSFADYADYVRKNTGEINELLNTILINVTEFFRDAPGWEILAREILPGVLKPLKAGHSFRAWSAGCASGEEAYSIAILLAEHFGTRIQEYDIKIYATDIDEEALNTARRGEYPAEALRRMFQRITGSAAAEERAQLGASNGVQADPSLRRDQMDVVRLQQHYLLETLRVGILGMGANDIITQNNHAALTLCGLQPADLVGRRLQETDFFSRIPELGSELQASRLNDESIHFQTRIKTGAEEKLLDVTVRPTLDDKGKRNGTLIYLEDQTLQEKLQTTAEELESTSEELQSANEELETTNEELQSTNEELETTNEELQSTNEELETTNEELQSLNEELETTNQELEDRTKELDQVNSVYSQTLEKIRLPVMLVDQDLRIEFWNGRALRLFGFKNKPPMEITIDQLPLSSELRNVLIRRHRAVLLKEEPAIAHGQFLGGKLNLTADIHFSVIPREDRTNNVLIMFEPSSGPGSAQKAK